jgi:hypothetical protein
MISNHFKRSLKGIAMLAALLVGLFLWLRHKVESFHPFTHPNITVKLPKNDVELITYNENRHIITTTTAAGTTRTYSRNPTVEIRKDGTVKVDSHAWGLEFNPMFGIGYQDTRRFYLGVNHFYFHQFDLFSAFGLPMNNQHVLLEPITGVSYNFWHNMSLNIGVNPANIILREKPEFGIMLSVRL